MNVLDLFSGIGGFSLGLERAGMRTVAFCEIEPFARRVLAKHWPDVPCYTDVRELTAHRLRADGISVDVICGGFPCQDISSAGTGAGIEGERSGLWKEYSRIIGEIRPRFVVVENVAALLSRGIAVVLGDLAALGYDAEWHCIPASAVGALHRRDRVWIVGYPHDLRELQPEGRQQDERRRPGDTSTDVAHADGAERRPHAPPRNRVAREYGLSQRPEGPGGSSASREDVADAERRRLQGGDVKRAEPPAIIPAALGRYCGGSEFGAPWWSEPDVGRVAHGIPDAMDRLKGLGNAVVPQIPEIIGRAIMTYQLSSHQSNTEAQ